MILKNVTGMGLVIKTEYPLRWPAELARTDKRHGSNYRATWTAVMAELERECRGFDVKEMVVTSNYTQGNIHGTDTAVSALMTRRGRKYIIACDRYWKATDNLRAICEIVAAYRTLERFGISVISR